MTEFLENRKLRRQAESIRREFSDLRARLDNMKATYQELERITAQIKGA